VLAWLLSAHSPAALAAQGRELAAYLTARPELDLADVAHSLVGRTLLEFRGVVRGRSRDELLAGLTALAEGRDGVTGKAARPKVGFVFAGQGAQKAGMGRGLYAASPVFAEAFDRAAELVEAELGHSIRDVVLGEDEEDARADRTLYAQTGLFAVEVGLLAVLAAAGVKPDAVAGHSVGEIAAAYAAGVLELGDAAKLVAARARLMEGLPDGGAMGAIEASEAEVLASLEGLEGVGIAAVNGPTAVVVSGDAEGVDRVVEAWREQGRRVRRLRVSHAFHSARMDPVLDELTQVAAALRPAAPSVTWVGALTGQVVTEPAAGYWPKQARQAVRFGDVLTTMAEAGVSVIVEIGPDGTLSGMGGAVLGERAEFVPLLRARLTADDSLVGAVSRLHVAGVGVDWARLLPKGRRVELPTYAFQNQRYWAVGPRKLRLDGGSGSHASSGGAAEAGFWSAVEDGDLGGLAKTLAMDGERLGELLPALTSWRKRELNRSATEGWRYRVVWEPIADPEPVSLAGSWLIVAPEAGVSTVDAWVARLVATGADVTVVHCSAATTTPAYLSEKIFTAGVLNPGGVVSLLAPDESAHAEHPSVLAGHGANQDLVQVLGELEIEAPLWILTSGAVEEVRRPGQAQSWGLGRVVGLEHPERWGGLIDLPETPDERAVARLVGVLAGGLGAEDQVIIRERGVLARRLEHLAQARPQREWSPRGTVLITGGTGAIGGHVAHWLADRGAPRIVLTSRSGVRAEGAVERVARLAESGTTVDVFQADISVREQVSGIIDRIEGLSAVMHTAGTAQATALAETSVAELAPLAAVKTAATRHLDELTADLDLDAFVLFSSISAIWGSGLQPGYAATNAFLDALAENRRVRGKVATSVAWGPWDGGGMSDREGKSAMTKRGLRLLSPELAVRALGQALDADETALLVADLDWGTFAPAFTLRRPSPLIEGLDEVREALAGGGDPVVEGETNALAEELAGLDAADQDRRLLELVRTQAAAVLSYPSPEDVDADRAFTDLGSDSLTAIELRNKLNAATGMRLSATLLFDFTSPRAVATHLRTLLVPEGLSASAPVLGELDRLEEMLDQAAKAEGEGAGQITARLESVLARWKESRLGKGRADVSEKLDSSSDEEVFDFLGKELGIF
jgi:acyl transferase domain-containing protein/acyl carrier protein